jgi:hypothetical protein
MKAPVVLLTLVSVSLVLSLSSAQADDACVWDQLASSQNGFAPQVRKEIQEGCSALSDDAYPAQCCKKSTDYLKKNPVPCSDKRRLRYQINLALSVCPKLSEGNSSCLDAMAYKINDPRVKQIDSDCLSESHSGATKVMALSGQTPFDSGNPLAMGEDHFAECQSAKLKDLQKQLDGELSREPADVSNCPQNQTADEKNSSKPDYLIIPTNSDPHS